MRLPSAQSLLILLSTVVITVALAACGGGGSEDKPPAPTVADAWIRVPASAELPGAGYLTLTSTADVADFLIAARSPISADIELHQTTEDASGAMGMEPVDRIEIPAGGTVALEPGGYHLMLLGLTELPVIGDTVEVTLVFEEAGNVVVQAEARAE
jgi:copper(I)-binding protein